MNRPRFRIARVARRRLGLIRAQRRRFNVVGIVVVALFAAGWAYAVATSAVEGAAPIIAPRITKNPLAEDAAPGAAFLLDAALRQVMEDELDRGLSGALRIRVQAPGDSLPSPDSLPGGAELRYQPTDTAGRAGGEVGTTGRPSRPGIWNVLLQIKGATRAVPDYSVISLVPLSARMGGRIGGYLVGEWPYEKGGRPRTAAYTPPPGLVQVTPQNQNLRVSEHFRLRDLLTKGQAGVWPKYVVVSPRMLDKVELTLQELESMGHPVRDVGVISAFRTPYYNRHGGNTGGRGALSRHMYGDAMDLYIDNNGDGRMDDLNGDGSVNIGDARVLARAAERVERAHPNLIGGIGVYRPTGAHFGFVHIDTRGFRARW